jgi:hypothetical protein
MNQRSLKSHTLGTLTVWSATKWKAKETSNPHVYSHGLSIEHRTSNIEHSTSNGIQKRRQLPGNPEPQLVRPIPQSRDAGGLGNEVKVKTIASKKHKS